jgi:hypothetical protein
LRSDTFDIIENEFSQVGKNWGNNVDYRPLDLKYKTIFKCKRNWEKFINDWDVKIKRKKLRNSFSTLFGSRFAKVRFSHSYTQFLISSIKFRSNDLD